MVSSPLRKWGAEHPFPPRSPIDLFTAACPQPVLDALNAGSITMSNALEQCSRAVLNPPAVFLRDYIGIDPYNTVAFTFADHPFKLNRCNTYDFLISVRHRLLCCC